VAKIYGHQEKYSEALIQYNRDLELQKQYLSENDPSLAETYNTMSRICFKQSDYGKAS
jgi:hypothetical protein